MFLAWTLYFWSFRFRLVRRSRVLNVRLARLPIDVRVYGVCAKIVIVADAV